MKTKMSVQTLQRLPVYLDFLKERQRANAQNISARAIAAELGLGEIQVRKDLACVSNGGKPKIGYIINDLIADIEFALGYNDVNDAVLVGAGKLGRALMSYGGFTEYGLNIVAGFDTDENIVDTEEAGKQILHIDKLKNLCSRMRIHIGIITVPAYCAQAICDMLTESGVTAIWNFAPTHLKAPAGIMIKNENMAVSLAELSKHITKKIYSEEGER